MRRIQFTLATGVALATFLSTSHVSASDWPNWRGPSHNGISTETGWVSSWPTNGPTQLWKKSIGTGFSSISISEGRVYSMGNTNNTDTLFCLDAKTGKEIWSYSYSCPLDPKLFEGGPTATPTVDGGSVYTISRKGNLFCFAADSGKVLWTNNVASTNGDGALGFAIPGWGFASSAYIDKDLVIFNVGATGTAFNKKTGAVVWKTGAAATGYTTPVPCDLDGKQQIVYAVAQSVVGMEPQTGKELWRFPWKTSYDINAADPIIIGDKVFISSGYDHGAALFQLKDNQPTKLWEQKKFRNHFSPSVLLDGYFYGFDGTAGDGAKFVCMDLQTGTVKWTQEGLGSGSVILADNKLIILSSSGELVTATPSPEAFKPISRAQVLEGKCWTTPALANGRIYCRNAKGDLVCLDVTGK